jgi:hypothetical protein
MVINSASVSMMLSVRRKLLGLYDQSLSEKHVDRRSKEALSTREVAGINPTESVGSREEKTYPFDVSAIICGQATKVSL